MVRKKIIWSKSAITKLFEILEFFEKRNKSKTYSAKLYQKINKELELLHKYPDLGKKTDIDAVRGLIIGDYILFY